MAYMKLPPTWKGRSSTSGVNAESTKQLLVVFSQCRFNQWRRLCSNNLFLRPIWSLVSLGNLTMGQRGYVQFAASFSEPPDQFPELL
jgi:hypothetical protein